jgi:hypothetical protein
MIPLRDQLCRRAEPDSLALSAGGHCQPRCQMRLARSCFTDKNCWFFAHQVAALAQRPDHRCWNMWRALKIKFFQCLDRRKMRFLDAPRYCFAIPFLDLDLGFEQRLQITQVRSLFLSRFFSQGCKLITSCCQVQLPGILQNGRLLNRLKHFHSRCNPGAGLLAPFPAGKCAHSENCSDHGNCENALAALTGSHPWPACPAEADRVRRGLAAAGHIG